MSLNLLFWVLYLVALVFGMWPDGPLTQASFRPLGGRFLVFVLIGLLGWATFGAAIHK
jgi:hypothetical protein